MSEEENVGDPAMTSFIVDSVSGPQPTAWKSPSKPESAGYPANGTQTAVQGGSTGSGVLGLCNWSSASSSVKQEPPRWSLAARMHYCIGVLSEI